jgi:hypothetical protein
MREETVELVTVKFVTVKLKGFAPVAPVASAFVPFVVKVPTSESPKLQSHISVALARLGMTSRHMATAAKTKRATGLRDRMRQNFFMRESRLVGSNTSWTANGKPCRSAHVCDRFYRHIARPEATKPKKGRIGHGQGRIGRITGRVRLALGRISGESESSVPAPAPSQTKTGTTSCPQPRPHQATPARPVPAGRQPNPVNTPTTQVERGAAQRLRTTMAAFRLAFTWLGVRMTLAPEQRTTAA